MKEISIDESKKIQLNILKCIDSFCRKNEIHYSLAGGTLIGAVRHKGFIPWDDDIDLMMMRDDYERFLSLFKDEKYKLLSWHNYNEWESLYSSVVDPNTEVYWSKSTKSTRGIWVSIFPIDRIPDDDVIVSKMINKVQRLSKGYILRLKASSWTIDTNVAYNLAKAICRFFLKVIPYSMILKPAEKIITSYNDKETSRFSSSSEWAFDIIFNFSSKDFNGYEDMKFEDMKAMVCSGYDDYLKGQYGDYMQLPPEEERVARHDCRMYYK